MSLMSNLQKRSEQKYLEEQDAMKQAFNMSMDKAFSEDTRLAARKRGIELFNKQTGSNIPSPSSLPAGEDKAIKDILNTATSDMDASTKAREMKLKVAAYGLDKKRFDPVIGEVEKEGRAALLKRPDTPGLPAETQSFKSSLMGEDVSLTRPEIPRIKGGLTSEAKEMGEIGRQQFVETGKIEKKPKRDTQVVELATGKYLFDKQTGERIKRLGAGQAGEKGGGASDKWTKDAGTILDKFYGTLTDTGYVVDPERMDEFQNAHSYLGDYKDKGLNSSDAAVLSSRRAAAGGTDPIVWAIEKFRGDKVSDKEIMKKLKEKFPGINPRTYGLK